MKIIILGLSIIMKYPFLLILLLQCGTAFIGHASVAEYINYKDFNFIEFISEIDSTNLDDNQKANQLIDLWYNGHKNTKKKLSRYDIYPAVIWTQKIEEAYSIALRDGSKETAFKLKYILGAAYHDQTKFEKALPLLEAIYQRKKEISAFQYQQLLIKLEEEYRAFNYIEKAIVIRKERINNQFINTYWEIYRDCGLIEAAKKDFIQFEPIPAIETEDRLQYYVNLGELYYSLNQYDSAKVIFLKGVDEAKLILKNKDIDQKIRLQNLNFWLGCLTGNAAKCDIARGIYINVLSDLYFDIAMSQNDIDNRADKMLLLANVLLYNKQYAAAKKYIDSATNYMLGKTIKHVRQNLYNTKSKYYKSIGQLDSALYYVEIYNEYNRMLNNNLQKNQSVLLLAELEISNRRSELIASQAINLKNIVHAKTQKQQLIISLFSICIILAFVFGLYLNNKQKLKNKKQIEAQNLSLLENSKWMSAQNEKNEMLLKELHHRVKNNLQVMYSLINLQKRRNKANETIEILSSVQNRIQTMALVHENLYKSTSFDHVEISTYIKTLVNHLQTIYTRDGKNIDVLYDIQSKFELPIEVVISLGLIVNEAVSNAFKYAFVNRPSGKIEILIEARNEMVHIEIHDDGPGFKDEDIKETSLGIKLIKIMCSQLEADYTLIKDHGITHKIEFKL